MEIVAIASAAASVSYTIAQTSVFSWLREKTGALHPKLDELVHCPYCLGHWISFVMLGLIGPTHWLALTGSRVINFFLTTFCVMGIVALMHFVMVRAYAPVAMAESLRKQRRRRLDNANS